MKKWLYFNLVAGLINLAFGVGMLFIRSPIGWFNLVVAFMNFSICYDERKVLFNKEEI